MKQMILQHTHADNKQPVFIFRCSNAHNWMNFFVIA